MTYWVYLLASDTLGTLYVGVTNSLERRVAEHKAKAVPGFTDRHDVSRLVWFQDFGDVTQAIHFEKQLKRWRRDWKLRLIERRNPHWADLYLTMMDNGPLNPDLVPPTQAVIPVSPPGEDRDPTQWCAEAALRAQTDGAGPPLGPGLRFAKPG